MLTDTIAAISTAVGNSGISIIRISGKDSLEIIKKIFKTRHELKHSSIVYGHIVDNISGEKLDEVLVSYFENPKSFTGEDVCEVNCHGGRKITLEILELILRNGARLAEPGEFTKRAFLNGKVDLTQAEAIMDVIGAQTKKQSKIATEQLSGNLSKKINGINEKLLNLMAQIEVSVDYPEYDYEELSNDQIKNVLKNVENDLNSLISTYDDGKIIRDGIKVAIIGKPNVGKSSLLNTLAKYEKAIVTDIAGTTRDVIEESINIGELVLNVFDTAGIRETEDVVEKIGVEKSKKTLEEAELILFLVDATVGVDQEEYKLLKETKNKNVIVIINKIDIASKENIEKIRNTISCETYKTVLISAKENEGIEELKEIILKMFNNDKFNLENDVVITSERHKSLLVKAKQSILSSINTVEDNMPIEIITIEIRNSMKYLGEITGTNVSEEVIKTIFQKFCLGK